MSYEPKPQVRREPLPPELNAAIAHDTAKALAEAGAAVTIYRVGSWYWAEGDTKAHKDILKCRGWFWHGKRMQWFLAGAASRHNDKRRIDSEVAEEVIRS